MDVKEQFLYGTVVIKDIILKSRLDPVFQYVAYISQHLLEKPGKYFANLLQSTMFQNEIPESKVRKPLNETF